VPAKFKWAKDIETQCEDIDGAVNLSPGHRKKSITPYDRVALAIAAFEGSNTSNAFTAKIDAIRTGLATFTPQEKDGRDLFRGKGKCTACHVGARGPGGPLPLLTNYTFSNLGVPRNPDNPFSENNPKWRDPGLGGFLKTVKGFTRYANANEGKQKVPTLRNVGLGSCEAEDVDGCIVKAYMHNGYFIRLMLHFLVVIKVCRDLFLVYQLTTFKTRSHFISRAARWRI
jgi:cytochrome c peroxidase